MAARKRIAFYCQHATGVGHYVRALGIAERLAGSHDVTLISGGRPFPGSEPSSAVTLVQLPPLQRSGAGLAPAGPGASYDGVLVERSAILRATIARVRPDVLFVEHFPFSRWSLRGEITETIEAARRSRPGGRVLCSLRDIARKSAFDTWGSRGGEAGPPAAWLGAQQEGADPAAEALDRRYGDEVVPALNGLFDALLVHGDPRLTRLEDQIGWTDRITIPIVYTGYVTRPRDPRRVRGPAGDFVLVSAGGGAEGAEVAGPCLEAWAHLGREGGTRGHRMELYTGVYADELAVAGLIERAAALGARVRRFSTAFSSWLRACALSVSRAGYNTCVEILAARARAILVPSARMADQWLRAQRLRDLGLAELISPLDATPERIAHAIAAGLSAPRPQHDLALDGAEQTLAYVNGL